MDDYGLVQISFAQAMTPWAFAGFSFAFISIFIALYVWMLKVGFQIHRLANDYQYRIRFILCVLMLFNRITDIIRLFLLTKSKTWPVQTERTWQVFRSQLVPLRLSQFGLFYTSILTSYMSLLCIFLLTVDRYKRVAMVLPRSMAYNCISLLTGLFSILLIYIIVGYSVAYFPYFILGYSLVKEDTKAALIVLIRKFAELTLLFLGICADYYFTIRLIIISTRTMKQRASVNNPKSTASRTHLIALLKQRVAIKMIALFASLAFMDLMTVVSEIVLNVKVVVLSDDDFEFATSILQSWISVRVWLVYELLDMFLYNLQAVQRPMEIRQGFRIRLKRFIDSFLDRSNYVFTKAAGASSPSSESRVITASIENTQPSATASHISKAYDSMPAVFSEATSLKHVSL